MILLQKQFKVLIFKNIVGLLMFIFTLNNNLFSHDLPNDSTYIQSLYDSSKVYYKQVNYTKAIEYLDEIINFKSKTEIDSEPQFFKVYNRLGLVYKSNGSFRKAIDYYGLALQHTSVDYYKSLINNNIANILTLLGDYSKAISYLENSFIILEKSTNENKIEKIINNYHNQGYAYYQSRQLKPALQKSLKSIQLAKENKQKINITSYSNCGLIYKDLDSLNKADFYFKKAIEAYEEEYGIKHYLTAMAYISHAVFYAETGEFEKGEKLFQKSYKILMSTLGFKHYYTALCLKYTGDLFYEKQDYGKALYLYQQALKAKIPDFNNDSIYKNPAKGVYPDLDLIDVLNAKAKALAKLATKESLKLSEKKKNLLAALRSLELNVGFIENLRAGYLYESSKLQLASKEHNVYVNIVEIAYALFKITGDRIYAEKAFTYAELSRYAILRELENEEKAKEAAGIPTSLQEKEKEMKERLVYLDVKLNNEKKLQNPDRERMEMYTQEVFGLSKELDLLHKKLKKEYPLFDSEKYQKQVSSRKEIQESLSPNKAILEYVLSKDALYTFVITKNHFVFHKQAITTNFHEYLDFYRSVLHSQHTSDYRLYRTAAYGLYRFFISPFENYLKGKSLVIIPDDKMSYVSFDALPDKPYKKVDELYYKDEPFLIKRYPIAYAYSASLYKNSMLSDKKGKTRFLGLAPGYKNSKDSLRHIAIGLKNIKKLAFLTLGKSLTGMKASERNFRNLYSKYNVVHFYAHGVEDRTNPSNSKLYLSSSEDPIFDNYLHAWEISNLHMNARLVVLGSCFSGSGKFSKGEGVLSIARSFIYAGCKSVLMSLWIAPDKPTNEILNYFYLELFKGQDKDEALQKAKLKYLENSDPIHAHPRFWTGIVVNGNQDALFHYWYTKRALLVLLLLGGFFWFVYQKKR